MSERRFLVTPQFCQRCGEWHVLAADVLRAFREGYTVVRVESPVVTHEAGEALRHLLDRLEADYEGYTDSYADGVRDTVAEVRSHEL